MFMSDVHGVQEGSPLHVMTSFLVDVCIRFRWTTKQASRIYKIGRQDVFPIWFPSDKSELFRGDTRVVSWTRACLRLGGADAYSKVNLIQGGKEWWGDVV